MAYTRTDADKEQKHRTDEADELVRDQERANVELAVQLRIANAMERIADCMDDLREARIWDVKW